MRRQLSVTFKKIIIINKMGGWKKVKRFASKVVKKANPISLARAKIHQSIAQAREIAELIKETVEPILSREEEEHKE